MKHARVFWMDTDGGKPGDGAWYWHETDEFGALLPDDDNEPRGPFETALAAGGAARKWIVTGTVQIENSPEGISNTKEQP